MSKPKLAISWNSSCGGCDETIVDLAENILDIAGQVEFVLWPCAMDFKYDDVEKLSDGDITVSLINGGIQNTHQERVAKLLRKKSIYVIAFGSCAVMGGVPSLANLTDMKEIFRTSYIACPTVENPEKILPKIKVTHNGLDLTLPENFKSLQPLEKIIEVDYFLPGCPPTADMVLDVLKALLENNLPEVGSVLASNRSLCSSCDRNSTKPDKVIMPCIKRIHEVEADQEICFLAQNILCMGAATRDGCDYPCVKGNMPCTGCMGAVSGADQGAKMIGSLGTLLGGDSEKEMEQVLDGIIDPAGTFYRYGVSASLLGSENNKENQNGQ